jgi:UDP-2,3-diacylglucosamine hydrolase
MSIYFISDLHLSPEAPHLTEKFFEFLRDHAREASALYILGDFFEAWIGDDAITPWHETIAKALHDVSQQGVTIYIMHGNRDFLLGQGFIAGCGAHFIAEPYLANVHDQQWVLLHGDVLCLKDVKYQRMRYFFRKRWVQGLFLSLPRRLRQKIALWLRQSSHKEAAMPLDRYDATLEALHALFQQFPQATVIHGHTHQPSIHWIGAESGWQRRYVLSDWGKQGNMLIYRPDEGFRLSYF